MRIISGIYGRRTLAAPRGLATRPTSGRVREAVFAHLEAAILAEGFGGLRVLDLFAGSGALGLEALSRGAASAVLLDRDPNAVTAIRSNIAALGCQDQATVLQAVLPAALARLRPAAPFDLVFADPPYAMAATGSLLDELAQRGLVSSDAVAVWESDARSSEALPAHWKELSDRRHGDTRVRVLTRLTTAGGASRDEAEPDAADPAAGTTGRGFASTRSQTGC